MFLWETVLLLLFEYFLIQTGDVIKIAYVSKNIYNSNPYDKMYILVNFHLNWVNISEDIEHLKSY